MLTIGGRSWEEIRKYQLYRMYVGKATKKEITRLGRSGQ